MEHAHVRTRQLPPLQRGCERSRLEEQLVATTYELAAPIYRQTLSTSGHPEATRLHQSNPVLAKEDFRHEVSS